MVKINDSLHHKTRTLIYRLSAGTVALLMAASFSLTAKAEEVVDAAGETVVEVIESELTEAGLTEGELITEQDIPEELAQFLTQDDYELRCMVDENGYETWYLVNNLEGTRISISEFNNIASLVEEKEAENRKLASRFRLVVIILVVVIALLGAALSIVIYLWRQEIKRGKRKGNKHSSKHAPGNISGNSSGHSSSLHNGNKDKSSKNSLRRTQMDVDDYGDTGATRYDDSQD